MTHYQPLAAPPRNGLGTAGLVLGILGLLFSFVPLVGVIAWPLVILGLVFGGIGIGRARRGEATNKGQAVAGVVCSAAGLVVCVIYLAAFSHAASDLPEYTEPAYPQTDYSPPTFAMPSTEPQATAEPAADGSFGDGVWLVGDDIEPGTYRTTGAATMNCYWERLSGLSGELDDIIANANTEGPAVVEVSSSDVAFSSNGCAAWQRVS